MNKCVWKVNCKFLFVKNDNDDDDDCDGGGGGGGGSSGGGVVCYNKIHGMNLFFKLHERCVLLFFSWYI